MTSREAETFAYLVVFVSGLVVGHLLLLWWFR